MKATDINIAQVSALIPLTMNALYNDEVLQSTSLEEIRDAFRVKQMQGKQWLLNHLCDNVKDKSKSILIIGGWFGFTSLCLFNLGFNNITDIDCDLRVKGFAEHLNRFNKHYKRLTLDINDLDNLNFDIIINTSCEHIIDQSWFQKINNSSLIILQSTNYKSADHVNICNNIDEMKLQYFMNYVYADSLDFEHYKRFMLIGKKL